jgi:hypothetical protein
MMNTSTTLKGIIASALSLVLIPLTVVAPAHAASSTVDTDVLLTAGVWDMGDLTTLAAGSDVALVLGPTGIPTPSESYIETVYNNYLIPTGLYNGDMTNVFSLTTPELSGNTAEVLPMEQADIMAALVPLLMNGHDVTLFGYSQSTAAINASLNELYDTYGEDVTGHVNFVMVGNSGSPFGMLNNLYESLPSWMQWLLYQTASMFSLDRGVLNFGENEPSLYITPDNFRGDVFTLGSSSGMFPDGYATWGTNSLADGSWIGQFLGMFTTHEMYLGVSAEDVASSLAAHGGGDLVNYIDLNPTDGPLTLLAEAAMNVGWVPASIGEPLSDFFSTFGL